MGIDKTIADGMLGGLLPNAKTKEEPKPVHRADPLTFRPAKPRKSTHTSIFDTPSRRDATLNDPMIGESMGPHAVKLTKSNGEPAEFTPTHIQRMVNAAMRDAGTALDRLGVVWTTAGSKLVEDALRQAIATGRMRDGHRLVEIVVLEDEE